MQITEEQRTTLLLTIGYLVAIRPLVPRPEEFDELVLKPLERIAGFEIPDTYVRMKREMKI